MNQYWARKNRAFTLIEMMLVIVIIGMLVSVGSLSWIAASARSRDNIRKADLARLKTVLQQYYSDLRTYPAFDNAEGRIYSAEWQLSDTTNGFTCRHGGVNSRLSSRYITQIPGDPRWKLNRQLACRNLATQTGQYLYLSYPATPAGAQPSSTPSGFRLLATMERSNDQIPPAENPLFNSITNLEYYHNGGNNGNSPFFLNANYMISETGS